MKKLCLRAVMVAVLLTPSVSISAAPQKPAKPSPPPKPQPPANPTPGENFVQCLNEGNSVQVCMLNFGT